MRFVWIIYCYSVDPFSLHGKLSPTSGLSWANPRPGAEPTSPGFCFSGASLLPRTGSEPCLRGARRGTGVAARSSFLVAEAQTLSSGRFLSPPARLDPSTSPTVPEDAQPRPFLQAPVSSRPEVAFSGGHRLGKAGRRDGAAARPPRAVGELRCSGPLSSRTSPAEIQLAPRASRTRASEPIPLLPSPAPSPAATWPPAFSREVVGRLPGIV